MWYIFDLYDVHMFSAIHTAAIEMLTGADSMKHSRKPDIMADAAYVLMCKDARSVTGQFLIDDEVLAEAGLSKEDLDQYACVPSKHFIRKWN